MVVNVSIRDPDKFRSDNQIGYPDNPPISIVNEYPDKFGLDNILGGGIKQNLT